MGFYDMRIISNYTKEVVRLYTIVDKTTGRFISEWSLTEDDTGRLYLISWTGKLGSRFYSTLDLAKVKLKFIKQQFFEYNRQRDIDIVKINVEKLQIGSSIRENIT